MRPGRFEVQIEVPKPRTAEQRIEILRVHTDSMARNGRVVVKDAPQGTAAWSALQVSSSRLYTLWHTVCQMKSSVHIC